jgi:hypothetical protein
MINTHERILNCLPSTDVEDDWTYDNAANAGIVSEQAALPTSIDLRKSWWTINDQGATGSCVGWAAADSVIRWHLVKANRLPKNRLLSSRYVWVAAKETDEFQTRPTAFIEVEGTSLKAALDIVRRFGCVEDTLLPFSTSQVYTGVGGTKAFYAIASQLKIASYFNLGSNHHDWRTWLATQGPILTRLNVDATWYEATANEGKLDVYQPNTTMGGHAVAVVGYNAYGFYVRNSWGVGWGDEGFGYASYAYAQDAFTEAYGITLI